MPTTKPKKIRALVGLRKLPEGTIKDLLAGSLKGLAVNAKVFPKPPIELAEYQATIEAYQAAIPAALDGSKTAVANKNKLLETAIQMYVERSEEHTSELQSPYDLVCRLLLEKKK